MLDLDRVEALANAATPGPWSVAGLALLLRFGDKNDGPWNEASDDAEYLPRSRDDAALIVALAAGLPALVAELRAARAEIERLRTAASDERADVIAALADRAARARSYPRTDLGDGVADALDDMAEEIRSGAHVGAAKGGERG